MIAPILVIVVLFIIFVSSITILHKPDTKGNSAKFKKIKNTKDINDLDIEEKGKAAEKSLITDLFDLGFSDKDAFENLYINKENGKFAQIDAVLLTKVGVIVFEVKNYSGLIYGDASEHNWTQILANGEVENSFYNPVKQNHKHIVELKKSVVELSHVPFYSVIVFYGNCELKNIHCSYKDTFIIKPAEIFDVINYFMKRNHIIEYDKREYIVAALKQYAINGLDTNIVKRHSKNVADMLGNVERTSTKSR